MIAVPATVDQLLGLYAGAAGRGAYDESVSELEHALQCADLAAGDGAGDDLVAAALLHDVGHLLASGSAHAGTFADDRHEVSGARVLRRLCGPAVSGPVALHVRAKRYLCATDPTYLARLSPGSVRSLALQGGPMTAPEAAAFEALPGWEAAVRLRRWDDAAKVPGAVTTPLAAYRDLLVNRRRLRGA